MSCGWVRSITLTRAYSITFMRIEFLIQAFLIYAHFFGNKFSTSNKDYGYVTEQNVWYGLHNQLGRSVPQLANGWETACKPTYRGSGFVVGVANSSVSYVMKVTDSILEPFLGYTKLYSTLLFQFLYVYSSPELILHLEIQSKCIGSVLDLKFIDFSLLKRLNKSKILSLTTVLEKAFFAEKIAIRSAQLLCPHTQTAIL